MRACVKAWAALSKLERNESKISSAAPSFNAVWNAATKNSVVLNVTYLREVLDRINFDGVIEDIWAIRSSGFVHPELQ